LAIAVKSASNAVINSTSLTENNSSPPSMPTNTPTNGGQEKDLKRDNHQPKNKRRVIQTRLTHIKIKSDPYAFKKMA